MRCSGYSPDGECRRRCDHGNTDKSTRKFDPMAVPGLSNEARDAVNAAFDAMSTWRTETVNNSEKNLEQVIEKMAAAARALGWPEQIVDATRSQMQTVTKTQIQVMDQMMDAWEEQIKSPNPSAMLSKLNSLSGFGPGASWPNLGDVSTMNPCSSCNLSSSGRRCGRTRWRFGPRLPARSGPGLEHKTVNIPRQSRGL